MRVCPAGAKALRKQQAAGGYDRALFRSTRLWAPSTGGVEARAAPLPRLGCQHAWRRHVLSHSLLVGF